MHMIAYISDFNHKAGEVEKILEDISKVATTANIKHKVTGALFYLEGKFLQVIEGLEPDLRQLMNNIESDRRHENIEYLVDARVEKRDFEDWQLNNFELNVGKAYTADHLKQLTADFQEKLIKTKAALRSDTLIYFYKTFLDHQPAAI